MPNLERTFLSGRGRGIAYLLGEKNEKKPRRFFISFNTSSEGAAAFVKGYNLS